MIPVFLERRRKNLVERLNRAIAEFPALSIGEYSKTLDKARHFLWDGEIKNLYEILLKKNTEHDDQLSKKLLERLDSKTINELENFRKEWGRAADFTTLWAKAFEITLKRLSHYVEEELKSWAKVFPNSVIKEIRSQMTLSDILDAAMYFRKKYKETLHEKEAPSLYVEGDTDKRYLERAAELLGKKELLGNFEISAVGGYGNLRSLFNGYKRMAFGLRGEMIFLYDSDTGKKPVDYGKLHERTIPKISSNPIDKGIENLFNKSLLEKAKNINSAFVVVAPTSKIKKHQEISVPEVWRINEAEKVNLCDWIIHNGTKEDFEKFDKIIELLTEINNAS